MPSDPAAWRLYVIPVAPEGMPVPFLARRLLEGGAGAVQLRLKGVADDAWIEAGAGLLAVCREFGRPLIINDRPDIALRLGADGVHLGQEDAAAREARGLLGKGSIIGVSVTGPAEARRAAADGADYVAVGPVYATPRKEGVPPLGLEAVRRVREAVDLPLIAIGGIDAGNASMVIEAGADGVAVISAVCDAPDPRREAEDLLARVTETVLGRRSTQ